VGRGLFGSAAMTKTYISPAGTDAYQKRYAEQMRRKMEEAGDT